VDLTHFVPDQPVIPGHTFNLKDFGAVGDGATSATAAFRHGIAAVKAAGGGRLVVPSGVFLTGPIDLCSGIDLHLEAGATVLFSAKPGDYPASDSRPRPEILARSLHDVMISGSGTFDGQGQGWWAAVRAHRDPWTGQPVTGANRRPHILSFIDCRRIRVEGVHFQNSPMYNMTITGGRDSTVDGVSILNPPDTPNTDGIDPKGAQRVLITHCRIDTGDDCIALGGNAASIEEDILVTDCTFLHGHGCSIGSGTTGGVRNLLVRRCTFDGTESGVRLKSSRTRGGLTENLVYEDLAMTQVGHPISINSHYEGTTTDVSGLGHTDFAPVSPLTPIWRHILIRNLRATDSRVDAGLIVGLPEMPAEDITLDHVTIEAPKGLLIAYAKGVTLRDTHLTAREGAPVITGEMVRDLKQ
jgi:polygalacturonase